MAVIKDKDLIEHYIKNGDNDGATILVDPSSVPFPYGAISLTTSNFSWSNDGGATFRRVLTNGANDTAWLISAPTFTYTITDIANGAASMNLGNGLVSFSGGFNVIAGGKAVSFQTSNADFSISTSNGIATYNGNEIMTINQSPDVSSFVTTSVMDTAMLNKANLGSDGLVLTSQLPEDRIPIRGTAVDPQVITDPDSGFTLVSCEVFNDINGTPVVPTEEDEYFGIVTKLIFRYTANDGKFWASGGQTGLQLGNTSQNAFRGDLGALCDAHRLQVTGNPHAVTKAEIGLDNVDNTSDTNKPVSTATQTALTNLQSGILLSVSSSLALKENAITKGTTAQYWRGDKTWQTLPIYAPTQTMQQTAISLQNGSATQVISATAQRTGLVEIEFMTGITANVSAVLALLTSDAVFASCSVQFRVNNVTQLSTTVQICRSGSAAEDVNHIFTKALLDVVEGQSIQIYILANEAGINIPVNSNTRLIIK